MSRLLLISFSIIILSNCGKDPDPNISSKIDLISPKESIENYGSILFTWDSKINDDHRFLIDTDTFFESPIFDTILDKSADELLKEIKLAPNAKFYWRLSAKDKSSTTSFHIEDLISQVEGTHPVEVRKIAWGCNPICTDTTYASELSLTIENESIWISENSSFYNRKLFFNSFRSNLSKLYYDIPLNSNGYVDILIIDHQADSIYAFKQSGGLSVYRTWEMSGEY